MKLFLFSFLVLIETTQSIIFPFQISHDVNRVKFYLYTNDTRNREEIKYTDKVSLAKSSFRRDELTVLLIHGFGAILPGQIMNNFIEASPFTDVNYIMVDWSALSATVLNPLDIPALYILAMRNVDPVGRRVGNFLMWIHYEGYLDLGNVHLVGISLGSHVAGSAGRHVYLAMGGMKVTRVTGLDPAGPLYYPPMEGVSIHRSDATFVDIYHSDIGFFGTSALDGHVDFILNEGHDQPGCNFVTDILTCSHTYALLFFMDSMTKPYPACQCSYFELDPANFDHCMSLCPNKVLAGVYAPHDARGEYHVHTGNLIKPGLE